MQKTINTLNEFLLRIWDEMAILVDDTKEIIDYIRENKNKRQEKF